VRAASIIRDDNYFTWQYIPEDSSELNPSVATIFGLIKCSGLKYILRKEPEEDKLGRNM
jgi:hypothetical protein